jgi:hypothetical protein
MFVCHSRRRYARDACPGTEFRVRHLEWLSAAPGLMLEHAASRPMVGGCTR